MTFRCASCGASLADPADFCTCAERYCESCWWKRQRELGEAACGIAKEHFRRYPNSTAGLS